jgi:hypothetical protein
MIFNLFFLFLAFTHPLIHSLSAVVRRRRRNINNNNINSNSNNKHLHAVPGPRPGSRP